MHHLLTHNKRENQFPSFNSLIHQAPVKALRVSQLYQVRRPPRLQARDEGVPYELPAAGAVSAHPHIRQTEVARLHRDPLQAGPRRALPVVVVQLVLLDPVVFTK